MADIGDIGDLYNFLKNLYDVDTEDTLTPGEMETQHSGYNEILNCPITQNEIFMFVKELKNNKSPGSDCIVNEHISNTISIVLPIYDSGIVPEEWLIGIVKPIYKNKGKIRFYDLSFDYQLDLFDKVVTPVLLHGCEIWVFENVDITERLHLRLLKYILNL